jgi:hypothetical protein
MWSIYLLTTVGFGLICGAVALWRLFPVLSGGAWFLIAIVLGGLTALIANMVRPRYEGTAGRWRSFYNFLLRQVSPLD